ncbi:AP-5 complex subunit sigma-1, putative [Plasmodium malariae]|uniref:AP-5 complex subunit sigma-1, putative n=1 Tax=Plasmodium malariae TaxID=5858 RepID=A0A1D3PA48_PLAMA|nr:AP-5 complex subunit sigma-1, putative [Plasmodium malariae]SCN12116.1 AP-5 complex subunit sigma-1, putative [Plasmodium malariae]
MVYGIIIHSAECHEKLYFSSYYSIESNDKNQYVRQQTIMKRVIEEIKYYEESKEIFENTTKNNKEKYFDLIGKFLSKNANNTIKIESEGFFRIVDPSLFKNKINIMWKVLNKICYTLVLFTHENIHLADYFLHTFIITLRERNDKIKKNMRNNTNLFNPDTVLAILYFFLPKGQLMLINQNYTKFLNNEVNKFLEEQAKVKTKDYKIE